MKVLPEAFLHIFFPTHTTKVAREKKSHEIKSKPEGTFVSHTCSYFFPNKTSVLSIDFMSLLQTCGLKLLLLQCSSNLLFTDFFSTAFIVFFHPSEKSVIYMRIYFFWGLLLVTELFFWGLSIYPCIRSHMSLFSISISSKDKFIQQWSVIQKGLLS